MEIERIVSRMILDSRGYPTVEVDLTLSDGSVGRASVPSGASTGSREAKELRDGGTYFNGKSVERVLGTIAFHIAPNLRGKYFASQQELDEHLALLDATNDFSSLGANALLPVSLAYARAVAHARKLPLYEHLHREFAFERPYSLPTPLINLLNGGKHAPHSTDIQEWMIVPLKGEKFKDMLELSARVFYELRSIMVKRGGSGVGDEGGFPLINANHNKEALVLLTNAVKGAGLTPGVDIAFALDVAASELVTPEGYRLECEKRTVSPDEMIELLSTMAKDFPIVSIEDGLGENDWPNWSKLHETLGSKIQLVGDDLFVTNPEYIAKGAREHSANAVLIKPNQIGTLSKTVAAIDLAHKNGMRTIISHRSGETEDTFIAHLAVASGAGQIKTGSLSRTERLAKYNELLRISESVSNVSRPFLH